MLISKVFAAILLNMDSPNNPKIHKLNNSLQWRLQFWIFLPFIWIKHKSSYHLFYTLTPSQIEIWFDLCVHHIWMLALCAAYLIYPTSPSSDDGDDGYKIGSIDLISSITYIVSFCFILIVTFIKLKASMFSKTS